MIQLENHAKESVKTLAAAFGTDDAEQVEQALAATFEDYRNDIAEELATCLLYTSYAADDRRLV